MKSASSPLSHFGGQNAVIAAEGGGTLDHEMEISYKKGNCQQICGCGSGAAPSLLALALKRTRSLLGSIAAGSEKLGRFKAVQAHPLNRPCSDPCP